MFAHRTKPKWDNHKGYGNVLEATRSGNELHPTQKPVEILEKLLDNTDWAEGVLDTFGGSGTTLIAAESVGQASFLIEMEPRFVDVIVRRYIKTAVFLRSFSSGPLAPPPFCFYLLNMLS